MKHFFNIIKAVLLYVSIYVLPLHADSNFVFESDTIFEVKRGGKKATLSPRTTNAISLQKSDIKGQLKSGKRLTAAIIDSGFYPEYTKDLKKRGLIHPAAFSERLILDPDENIERVNLKSIESQIGTLKSQNNNIDIENDSLPSQNYNIDIENIDIDMENSNIDFENTMFNIMRTDLNENDKKIENNKKKIETNKKKIETNKKSIENNKKK